VRIFGATKGKMAEGWRKLHNEGFHSLYSELNIIRAIISKKIRGVRHVAHMRSTRNVQYKILVRKSGRKRLPRRCRSRWEDKMNE
jgi:sulfite reductase beta subunit-like hemoprotein